MRTDSHKNFEKYFKELNSTERTEEANKFACGVQDLRKISMDLKGEQWFIHYMGKGLQILLGLEPGDVRVHTQAENRERNVFSKDYSISQNIFKHSGYEEIINSEKTHMNLTKFVPLLIPITIRALELNQIHRNNLATFPDNESLKFTLH